jgi:hypothetical protein
MNFSMSDSPCWRQLKFATIADSSTLADFFIRNQTTLSSMNSVPAVSRQPFWICRRRKVQISCCFPKGEVPLFLLET